VSYLARWWERENGISRELRPEDDEGKPEMNALRYATASRFEKSMQLSMPKHNIKVYPNRLLKVAVFETHRH
jgi:hypothetical protein